MATTCADKGQTCSSGGSTCTADDCKAGTPEDLNCVVDGDGSSTTNGCKCNDGFTDGTGLCTKDTPTKCSEITTTGITDSKQCAAEGGEGCEFTTG